MKKIVITILCIFCFFSCNENKDVTGIGEMLYYDCGNPELVISSDEYNHIFTIVNETGEAKYFFWGIEKVCITENEQDTVIYNTFIKGLETNTYEKELNGNFFSLKQENSKLNVCIDENKTKNNRIIRFCLNAGGHPIDDLVITQHKN